MLTQRIQPILDSLKRVLTEPRHELSRWQKALRFAYDLGRYGARQLREDQATQMAGALAFRTIFGLLPVLVVATMIAKGLMGRRAFEDFLREAMAAFVDWLNLEMMTVSAEDLQAATETRSLADFLGDIVTPIAQLDLAALTWLGVAVMAYAAIGLVVTIENSFNNILKAPKGRPWVSRITVYWTILTISPVVIALITSVDDWLNLNGGPQTQWWNVPVRVFSSFAGTWLFMTIIYRLVPNTSVGTRRAIAGAFVAAALLEVGKRVFGAYLANALTINLLYGSLGLIPLFMFWVYLMWLVILFGLEVAATLKRLGGRSLEEMETKRRPTGFVDPASILAVMEVIAERFTESQPTTAAQISERTGIAEDTIDIMLERLTVHGILHRIERDEGGVTLARPPEQVHANQLLEVGYELVDEGAMERTPAFLQRLREAQCSTAARMTLQGLLPRPAATAGAADQVRA